MIAALIPALAPLLGQIVGNLFPDPTERAKAEAEVMRQVLDRRAELEQAAAGIIKAEATSGNWLAAAWRPILMLTFGALIVARWLGWSAPFLSEAEVLKLWDIVELGIGGYVIGRSAEKILPGLAGAIKK